MTVEYVLCVVWVAPILWYYYLIVRAGWAMSAFVLRAVISKKRDIYEDLQSYWEGD